MVACQLKRNGLFPFNSQENMQHRYFLVGENFPSKSLFAESHLSFSGHVLFIVSSASFAVLESSSSCSHWQYGGVPSIARIGHFVSSQLKQVCVLGHGHTNTGWWLWSVLLRECDSYIPPPSPPPPPHHLNANTRGLDRLTRCDTLTEKGMNTRYSQASLRISLYKCQHKPDRPSCMKLNEINSREKKIQPTKNYRRSKHNHWLFYRDTFLVI